MISELLSEGGTVVEVGTWFGALTPHLAQLLKKMNKSITFFAVDNFTAADPAH
jgi:hypothetical protein